MELRQLRYFIAVAEEGNFGAGAARVNVTQPPVTRQIHALEQELGVRLFIRTPRGATLTKAGELFLDEARGIINQVGRATARSQAIEKGEAGHLSIAFFGSTIYRVIPEMLARFRAQMPDVDIDISQLSKVQQIEALRSGSVDISFSRYFVSAPDISVEVAVEEKLYVAFAANSPLAHSTALTSRDLEGVSMVLFPNTGRPSFADEVAGLLRAGGINPIIAKEAEDAISALVLVVMGFGLSIVPESVKSINLPGIKFVPFVEQNAVSSIHCAYRSKNKSPILHRFLTMMRSSRNDTGS